MGSQTGTHGTYHTNYTSNKTFLEVVLLIYLLFSYAATDQKVLEVET